MTVWIQSHYAQIVSYGMRSQDLQYASKNPGTSRIRTFETSLEITSQCFVPGLSRQMLSNFLDRGLLSALAVTRVFNRVSSFSLKVTRCCHPQTHTEAVFRLIGCNVSVLDMFSICNQQLVTSRAFALTSMSYDHDVIILCLVHVDDSFVLEKPYSNLF